MPESEQLNASAPDLAPCRVAVVSIGRSGTSLVSRILHEILEIDFGTEDEHIGADAANPDGYFENRDIMTFNEALLRSQGFSVAALPPVTFFDSAPGALRKQWQADAAALLSKYADHRPRFGFKDPRLSLDFPVWRAVEPALTPVIMFRHPTAVAASAAAQIGIDANGFALLWRGYYKRVFAYTAGMHRIVLNFERLLATPEAEIARLAVHLGVPPARYRPRLASLSTIVKPKQSRHSHLAQAETPFADADSRALYEYLLQCEDLNVDPDSARLAPLTASAV